MFQTKYNRKEFPKMIESRKGKRIVETAGYVSAKQRIESLISAGMRLRAYRVSQFDYPDLKSIDENFNDPTRRKGYDLADATQDKLALEARMNDRKKQNKPVPVAPNASGDVKKDVQGKEEKPE